MTTDPRVDAYIEKSAAFARPILQHFRGLLHASAPGATETVKWGMPFFEHKARPIAMMAAFKAHAGIGIFDGNTMAGGDGMGQFGKLISTADLPDDQTLTALIHHAVTLVDSGARTMRPAAKRPPLEMPADLAAALAAVPAAATAFAAFPPGAQREYIEWALEAKQEATRARRIATTVEQCAEGKKRYWAMAGR